MSQREDALYPAITLLAGGTLRPFSPEHGEAQHALSMIVGARDPVLDEKHPQVVKLPLKTFGKDSCWIITFMISGNEVESPA